MTPAPATLERAILLSWLRESFRGTESIPLLRIETRFTSCRGEAQYVIAFRLSRASSAASPASSSNALDGSGTAEMAGAAAPTLRS